MGQDVPRMLQSTMTPVALPSRNVGTIYSIQPLTFLPPQHKCGLATAKIRNSVAGPAAGVPNVSVQTRCPIPVSAPPRPSGPKTNLGVRTTIPGTTQSADILELPAGTNRRLVPPPLPRDTTIANANSNPPMVFLLERGRARRAHNAVTNSSSRHFSSRQSFRTIILDTTPDINKNASHK